jgi:heme A synthase
VKPQPEATFGRAGQPENRLGDDSVIDALWLPPWVHAAVGGLVLLATFVAAALLGWRAYRGLPPGRGGHASLIAAQVILMVQALIGIKLLDQGLGPKQLYIHYVGGLAPLMFMLLFYWLPPRSQQRRWTPFGLSSAAFVFAVMAFTIGQSYVASGSGL